MTRRRGLSSIWCNMHNHTEDAGLIELIKRYKGDAESVYNTWFVNGAERMKAFRAIRCGVKDCSPATKR